MHKKFNNNNIMCHLMPIFTIFPLKMLKTSKVGPATPQLPASLSTSKCV